jgi:hypothetical protein
MRPNPEQLVKSPFPAPFMRLLVILLLIPPFLHAQTAEDLFRDRRYDEARAALQIRLARDPADASAAYCLGRIAVA